MNRIKQMNYKQTLKMNAFWLLAALTVAAALIAVPPAVAADPGECRPTRPDSLGPFYKPGAPEREKVGTGYVLTGTVRDAQNCAPIPGARVELWLAGPDGNYRDDYRATIVSGSSGQYRLESHPPPAYYGRPPHIHIRVSADGFGTLTTQHYPNAADAEGTFDLVLKPE